MMINPFLELLVGLVVLPLLIYACYSDLRTREISNWVWVVIGALVIPTNVIRFVLYAPDFAILLQIAVSAFIGIGLGLLLGVLGLWGEADVKALIVLSLVSPLFPLTSLASTSGALPDWINALIPISLAYFMNAHIFVLPLLPVIPLHNLARFLGHREQYSFPSPSLWKRVVAFCTAYPASVTSLERKGPWHYDFIERPTENGSWTSALRIALSDPEEDMKRKREWLECALRDGRQTIWVQVGLPFVLPLTLSYASALLFGNIVVVLLSNIAVFITSL